MRSLADQKAHVLENRLLAMARSQDYRPIVAALCTQRGVGALSAIRFIQGRIAAWAHTGPPALCSDHRARLRSASRPRSAARVVLEVRLRAVRWLSSTAQACWHELRTLEGVRSQSDLTRTP
jgi:hypothetical protein